LEILRLGRHGTAACKGAYLGSGWKGKISAFTEQGLLQSEALFRKLFEKRSV
jgi:hypothetical protein